MRRLFVNDNFYSSTWVRVGAHIILWSLVFIMLLFQYQWVTRSTDINEATIGLTVGNFISVLITYYWASVFILPHLYNGRWLWVLVGIIFIYAVNSTCNYIFFTSVSDAGFVSPGIQRIADVYRKAGIMGGLVNSTVFVLNWSFGLNAVLPISLKFTKDIFVAKQRTINLERDNLSLELNFLRTQINPHFFFNTVNNVYSLIVDKDEQAAAILLKLSSLMRYVLYDSGTTYVPLHQEISFLSDYIGLEKIRHDSGKNIHFQIEGDMQSLTITPLVLITFIENAFKHGTNASIQDSWVIISIRIEGNALYFQAQNSKPSGASRDRKNPLPHVSGIGLANTQRRLQLLYPDRYQLQIQETPSIYTVDLMIILHGKQSEMPHYRRRTAGAGVA